MYHEKKSNLSKQKSDEYGYIDIYQPLFLGNRGKALEEGLMRMDIQRADRGSHPWACQKRVGRDGCKQ